MTPNRIDSSLRKGYLIVVRQSESPYRGLRPGSTYSSVGNFERALAAARWMAPEFGSHSMMWTFATLDGLITYSGHYELEAATAPDLLGHLITECDYVLEQRASFSVGAGVIAKAMKHVALSLGLFAATTREFEAEQRRRSLQTALEFSVALLAPREAGLWVPIPGPTPGLAPRRGNA